MDLYRRVSYELSQQLTLRYSSSFGMSSRLFGSAVRADIYAIYALVRIADEIVDSYEGNDQQILLDDLESETTAAITRGYSTNPIVHAFALMATTHHIDASLIAPFFASMRMDITPATYDQAHYETYIYGSAEVIGLMCLRVFCQGNQARYDMLTPSARALGSAYQKVNFLRDIAADHQELGRTYFPGVEYARFNESDKQAIITDIEADFTAAKSGLAQLPHSSKAAVMLSVVYYSGLLKRLKRASITTIKTKRTRINSAHKLWLFVVIIIRYKVLL